MIDLGSLSVSMKKDRELWTPRGKIKDNECMIISGMVIITFNELGRLYSDLKDRKDVEICNFKVQKYQDRFILRDAKDMIKVSCADSQRDFILKSGVIAYELSKYHINTVDIARNLIVLSADLPKEYFNL